MPSQPLSWHCPLACHAGKGAPEKLAIDRIFNDYQHDRTPLFDRRGRQAESIFAACRKWLRRANVMALCRVRVPARHPGPHSQKDVASGRDRGCWLTSTATSATGDFRVGLMRRFLGSQFQGRRFVRADRSHKPSSRRYSPYSLVVRRRDGEAQTRKSAFRHEVRLSMSRPNWRPQPRRVLAGSARYGVVGTASRVGPPDKALMSEDQNHGQGS